MIHHYNFESFLAKIDEYKLQNIELSRGTVSISDSTYEIIFDVFPQSILL